MEREIPEHMPEERLEAYAFGSLTPDETEKVEEHLLFCATCQDQLEAVERYTRAMRSAAKRIREETAQAPESPGAWDRVRARLPSAASLGQARLWLHPAPVLTGALAMAAVIFAVSSHLGDRPGAPVEVSLQAIRGESTGTAPAGHALHLRLDGRGVPEIPSWRIEIVDDDGARIWKGLGTTGPDITITAEVNQSFRPGTYFVRLLKEGQEDPAREYQLVVQKTGP